MDNGIEHLLSASKMLKANIEKSKALALSLEKTGPRLNDINQRLPSLEVAIRPIRAPKDALITVGGHINRAVVPATAVLKVFDAIHGLEKSLSDPQHDLSAYLGVLKRLEDALRFLIENCGMAIEWLTDIVEYLDDHKVADDWFISDLTKTLNNLREFESGEEKGRLDRGFLEIALNRLENEFRRLLTENSVPLPMSTPNSPCSQSCIAPSPLPGAVIVKLQEILARMVVNNGLERCVSIYIEVRSENVRASMRALDLDYLEISVSEFDDMATTDVYVVKWAEHLEFAVKHLFEAEYKLCNEVFDKLGPGPDFWKSCFGEIAVRAGILAFLRFGKTVTDSKKEPTKLLMLLDIFASLSKLRLDFNRLFSGAPCAEIQNLTRDLIKRVIEGACEIFWELLVQVELQRHTPPPSDCSIPRVVSFITDYCNKLLGDSYKPILMEVLVIERSWKNEKFRDGILNRELLSLVKAIELNLETWSDGYEDAVLSYLFLMNNHWHLYKHLTGTKLGGLLGDSWIREHEQYTEYCSCMFVKESWGKLVEVLSREGLISFSGGRANARNLVKQRLKSFNEVFDDMYKKQSGLVIAEKDLRDRTRQIVVQTVMPVYRSYVQNYGHLVDDDKYVKYTVQMLEKMFDSLFSPKNVKRGNLKVRRPSKEVQQWH